MFRQYVSAIIRKCPVHRKKYKGREAILYRGTDYNDIIPNKTGNWSAFVQPPLLSKSNEYCILWVCVCSLRYPTCNEHAPYCHLWPAPLYNIFPHYLINGTIFEKTLLNTKCAFWFSLQLLSETFLILRRNERDMIKNVYRSSCKVPIISCKVPVISCKVPVIHVKYRLFHVKHRLFM
jgi:hypothetical protein